METIRFRCFSCGQVLKVGTDKAGRKAKCLKCGTQLTIPPSSDEDLGEGVKEAPKKTAPKTGVPKLTPLPGEEEQEAETGGPKLAPLPGEEEERPKKAAPKTGVPKVAPVPADEDEGEEFVGTVEAPETAITDKAGAGWAAAEDEELGEPLPSSGRGRRRDEDDDDEPAGESRSRKVRSRGSDDDDDEDEAPSRARRRRRVRDDDDDDEDDVPIKRKRRRAGGDWPKTKLGVNLIFWGEIVRICTMALGFLGGILLAGMAGAMASREQAPTPGAGAGLLGGIGILAIILGVGGVTAFILGLVGGVFCVFAPQRNSMKIFAILAISFAVAAYALPFVGSGMSALSSAPGMGFGTSAGLAGAGGGLGLLSWPMQIARLVCFLLFMRAVGITLNAYDVVDAVKKLFILGGVLVGVAVLMGIIVNMIVRDSAVAVAQGSEPGGGAAAGGVLFMIFGCLGMIGGLVWYIWYVLTIRATGNAIATNT